MHHIGNVNLFASPERDPLPPAELDPSDFDGREEWLVIENYRQQLIRLGVDLAAVELEDAISAYPDRVEGAVLAFLERFTAPKLSATRKLAVLIRRGERPSNPVHNAPRHPVYTARDFDAPLMAPKPAPDRSLEELLAELNLGGVRAMAVRAMIKHNPQWELEIVDGKILRQKVAIEKMHLPTQHATVYT